MTGAVLSENGSTVVATVEYGNVGPKLTGKTVIGGVEEFSATTRKPLRTLLTMHAHYSLDGGGSEAGWYMSPCSLGPVDATGYHVLVSCDQFDRIDRGRVTPLPGPGPQDAL